MKTVIKWMFWAVLVVYLAFFNYVGPDEIGISKNIFSEEVNVQNNQGWYATAPWVRVSKIPTKPFPVSVDSAGRGRGMVKWVQFNPNHWKDFIFEEGFRWWWLDNRLSINLGHDRESRGVENVLRGYAFDKRTHPFLFVIDDNPIITAKKRK